MSINIQQICSSLGVSDPLLLLTMLPDSIMNCSKPALINNSYPGVVFLKLTPTKYIEQPQRGFGVWHFADEKGAALSSAIRHDDALSSSLHEAHKQRAPVFLYGVIELSGGYVQLKQPKGVSPSMVGRVNPVYKGIRKVISSDDLTRYLASMACYVKRNAELKRTFINLIFTSFTPYISCLSTAEAVVDNLLQAHSTQSLSETYNELKRLNTLVYIQSQLGTGTHSKTRITINNKLKTSTLDTFNNAGIVLTACQSVQLSRLIDKYTAARTINRGLLSGDVGTGKSMVIAGALIAVARAGGIGICMTVDEALSVQLVELVKNLHTEVDVKFVTSTSKPLQVSSTSPQILIGTTALINLTKESNILPDLLIIDEEHRFGAKQKNAMSANHTYTLLCTATCIPKTKQLALLKIMDVYTLQERPSVRQVKTRFFEAAESPLLQRSVEETLARMEQVLIVVPAVNETTGSYLRSVSIERVYTLWQEAFPGRVTVYHGQLPASEKTATMNSIKNNEFQIIIASTATEVGLNIPRLTHCVCVEPQRFGLSQLHQIRGRVGRYGAESFFDMFAVSEIAKPAMERVNALLNTDDGQEIAEQELKMRGFGSLHRNDKSQSGNPTHIIPRHNITAFDVESALLGPELDEVHTREVHHAI